MSLPSAAELAGPITDAFKADPAHTSQFDLTPLDRFNAGGVSTEAELAFEKARHDGITEDRDAFFAWAASPVLRWAQAPGRVTADGEPFKTLSAWLAAWPHALPAMVTASRSNLLNHKPANPYYKHFAATYGIHDAFWKHPKAPGAEIVKMIEGPALLAVLGIPA